MPRILFLNLAAFSMNGGIEKFNRCFLKALSTLSADGKTTSRSMSVYDDKADERYYDNRSYSGFKKNKVLFILKSIAAARAFDVVILGHINMAFAGFVIKKIFPAKKVFLIAHGIEVWEPLTGVKKKLLLQADQILAVSNFTKQQICSVQRVSDKNMTVFPNTIDPYFAMPTRFVSDGRLREQYGIASDDVVLFTLTRLSGAEQYKGYDMILTCLPEILLSHPNVKYVISGKYDAVEKERVDRIIDELKLHNNVKVTGFVKDEELVAHYQMADMFVMPSRGEGFGIVFIEAMVCGLPVMAGNADGSVDALGNGALGTLVNPTDKAEITEAIVRFLDKKEKVTANDKFQLQQKTLQRFGFNEFTNRLKNIVASI